MSADRDETAVDMAAEFMVGMMQVAERHDVSPEEATAAMFFAWCRILVNTDKPDMRALPPRIIAEIMPGVCEARWGKHPIDVEFTRLMKIRQASRPSADLTGSGP